MGTSVYSTEQYKWIRQNKLNSIGNPYLLISSYDSSLHAEQYTLKLDFSEEQQNMYEKRRYKMDNIVNVYNFYADNVMSQCANRVKSYIVVTERIPYRLSILDNISRQEGFYILHQSLNGFHQLFNYNKACYPSAEMIGILNDGQIKVWINDIFAINKPLKPINRQDRMIDELINVIQDKISDLDGFGINFRKQCINEQKTFFYIMKTTKKYLSRINFVREKFKLKLKQFAQRKAGLYNSLYTKREQCQQSKKSFSTGYKPIYPSNQTTLRDHPMAQSVQYKKLSTEKSQNDKQHKKSIKALLNKTVPINLQCNINKYRNNQHLHNSLQNRKNCESQIKNKHINHLRNTYRMNIKDYHQQHIYNHRPTHQILYESKIIENKLTSRIFMHNQPLHNYKVQKNSFINPIMFEKKTPHQARYQYKAQQLVKNSILHNEQNFYNQQFEDSIKTKQKHISSQSLNIMTKKSTNKQLNSKQSDKNRELQTRKSSQNNIQEQKIEFKQVNVQLINLQQNQSQFQQEKTQITEQFTNAFKYYLQSYNDNDENDEDIQNNKEEDVNIFEQEGLQIIEQAEVEQYSMIEGQKKSLHFQQT